MQVADLLGDRHISDWVSLLARRASATMWARPLPETKDMLRGLLCLPPHLLHRVLSSCLADTDLVKLLSIFPAALHPALVSSAASTGAIAIPSEQKLWEIVLPQLAVTPAPPPGLLSLSLGRTSTYPRDFDAETSGALLAHALSAHPSLTTLDLRALMLSPAFLRHLARGLVPGALPSVGALHLCTQVHPDGCAELGGTLKHLPALACMHVDFYFNTPPAGAAAGDLARYVHAGATPARLPQLADVTVKELCHYEQRAVQPESSSSALRLFSLVAAPNLTSLTFESHATTGTPARLRASLRHLSSLQELSINTDMHECGEAAGASWTGPAAADADVTLPALRKLHIASACLVAPVAMAAAFAACAPATLTYMRLRHVSVAGRTFTGRCAANNAHRRELRGTNGEGVKAAWEQLIPALGACSHLQELELGPLCSSYKEVDNEGFDERLAASLRGLRLLTRLRLHAPCRTCAPDAFCQLSGEALARALRGMPALAELDITGAAGALTVSGRESTLAALPELQRLTALTLCIGGLPTAAVAELIPQVSGLKELLVFTPVLGWGSEAVAAFQARFPGVNVRQSAVPE